MGKLDVLVIGTLNIDFVSYVPRFPAIGETIASTEFQQIAGGKAANQAAALQRLGKSVALVGKVGNDPPASFLKEQLSQEGILINHVYTSDRTPTGNSMILVDHAGQNIIITNQNANKELTILEADAAIESAKDVKAAMLQLEMGLDVAHRIILSLKKKKIPIFLNLAPVVPIDPKIRRLVDVLVVNEVEAEQLTAIPIHHKSDAELAVKQLLEEGQEQVVLTMGEAGVLIGSMEGIYFIPSEKVTPIDTTAAGDCFCGALVAYWLEHQDLMLAARHAVIAAAISVTRKGALPSLPYKKEVKDFIYENKGDEWE